MTAAPTAAAAGAARVLVVDDDHVFGRFAQRALQVAGYGSRLASDIVTARQLLDAERFDVLVLDIHLPDGSGIEFLASMQERCAQMAVVLATGQPSVPTAVQALRLAAVDYLVKPDVDLIGAVERGLSRLRRVAKPARLDADAGVLAEQLRRVADWLEHQPSPTAGDTKPAAAERSPRLDSLSPRERDIVSRLLDGHAPTEVANQLGIRVSTVRNHIQAVYRRIGVRTQLELIAKLRDGER